jgi:2-phospho-L-lactate/phosphoenolpyruvate guanylyltransferase
VRGRAVWSIVVPVKRLHQAKSRLEAGPWRGELALALACDTIAAALRCPRVGAVVAVTDDAEARSALAALGARVVGDAPDAGLNPALVHGADLATQVRPDDGVAAMNADLPALRPVELGRVLRAAEEARTAFLADADGSGTTVYAAAAGEPFRPAFGPDSRHRHRKQGARELALAGVDSVRRDVDTREDLREAIALGAGPRTTAAAGRAALA